MRERMKKVIFVFSLLIISACATKNAYWTVGHASKSDSIVEIYARGVEGFDNITTEPVFFADNKAVSICQNWGLKGANLITEETIVEQGGAPRLLRFKRIYQCLE